MKGDGRMVRCAHINLGPGAVKGLWRGGLKKPSILQ